MMYWWFLVAAIVFEILGTMAIKQTTLTNSYYWGSLVIAFYIISFTFLGFAVKKIDIGTAYAIWAGFGTASIAILSWLIFKEHMTLQKITAIVLIITGSVILKLQPT